MRHLYYESHRQGELFEQTRRAPSVFTIHLRWRWRGTWKDLEVII